MPPQTPTGPKPVPQKPNATISDAINYASENPSGFGYVVQAGKWLAGLIAALFRPAGPR